MTFRIMPRQSQNRKEGVTYYGFWMFGHPKGDPDKQGMYLPTWDTVEEAVAAAHCLGIDPHKVQGVGVFYARPEGCPRAPYPQH